MSDVTTAVIKAPAAATMTTTQVEEDTQLSQSFLQNAITKALTAILSLQSADGYWRHNIEGFVWHPAEYVLCMEYIGQSGSDTNVKLYKQLGNYMRTHQLPSGAWALEPESTEVNVSTSVMAYLALKIIGDKRSDEHMLKAKEAILQSGGIDACNQFARFYLAQLGIISWSGVLEMPVEMMLLPTWFPFHIYRVSMARVIVVPMSALRTMKKTVRPGAHVNLNELLPDESQSGSNAPIKRQARYDYQPFGWYAFFTGVDIVLKCIRPLIPRGISNRAIEVAEAFVTKRFNGLDGFGSVSISIQVGLMLLHALGYPADHPHFTTQLQALERLIVRDKDDKAYVSPFFSPVWDTGLTVHALIETEEPDAIAAAKKGLDWLLPLQIQGFKGDWAVEKPNVRPGGWAYFYRNHDYPDTDDTSVVLLAMHRFEHTTKANEYTEGILRGVEWIEGLQCEDGGWGAFDADNTSIWLDNIPLVEDKAVLDPPTADVTSRCLSLLAQVESTVNPSAKTIKQKAIKFLLDCQEPDGSWFGRWVVNYIYGTWSALMALNSAGFTHDHENIRKAADWLIKIQNSDGGWGEECHSYKHDYCGYVAAKSSPSQTAWSVLGLIAAGRIGHQAVEGGVKYLIQTQNSSGLWEDERYTALALPNFIYYANHGYYKYFPLFALARYRRMTKAGQEKVEFGF